MTDIKCYIEIKCNGYNNSSQHHLDMSTLVPQPRLGLKLKATEYTRVLPIRPFSTKLLNVDSIVFLVLQLITTELAVPLPIRQHLHRAQVK